MSPSELTKKFTRKDFMSDQDVRWCPGCGDYAILATIQRTLPEVGADPSKTVFISGIGCSSRFPYYMNTYGFHSIHGRAPAFATGLKLQNPELDVWVITGDGDGLSIGGNHLMHLLRRNVDLQLILFNNRIYGLTKGQYSPTSLVGLRSPSTPLGSVDQPVVPASLALGAGAHFVARSVDTFAKHLGPTFVAAREHKGTSFIEVLQNCPVFHDGAWGHIKDKAGVGTDAALILEHGKPMLFGENNDKGLRLRPNSLELEVVTVGEGGISESDILVHDETNRAMAFLLAGLEPPSFPLALGVLYRQAAPTYEAAALAQVDAAKAKDPGDLDALLHSGHTWTVE
ncbi:2-oxoacid:ferredoxin oxidoreductase subunit beta [Pseudenhygromyxa sp. WMMC2535]|uniref:2-oxoacid:ferredoxin oxidoreductase subunit beta n=1 Tax=Pseudenhygromyxa sp. WMMC2535 TaxID=2712867 RepID=UPI001552B00F|nr:2-oxoacid:ferredoxin oxidoreductase subunit beta [Pseudenhygromyxa sp. WMMC2535]NVB37466.1 2-oxoacid:ferredoxin oxidoreductase subunit beta [Pseudenhygromyxa sp. WMMC2535]